MLLEDLGLIGNCQVTALVARTGEIVWSCLPRFDSEPVFSSLLDERRGGRFRVGPAAVAAGAELPAGSQRYLPNTNVLVTTFTTPEGRFRVVDFAPRFLQHGRSFRPTQLIRIVEPLEGAPRVSIACEPRIGWAAGAPTVLQGSHHLQFEGFPAPLRLTTDIALASLAGQPFLLTERRHLILAWGEPVEEALAPLCERFLGETVRYWERWVKHCSIPPLFQEDVIRSALVLKLHCYEDTGAIVAATTTSVPESPGSGRTWDYRYCWLRDSYYVLGVLRQLGHFEEREQFTRYLLELAAGGDVERLAPLYRIDGRTDLDERELPEWAGYEGHGPVRVGNAAAAHRQHDIYGEMVLALTPVFLDERFQAERTPEALDLIERLAGHAIEVAGTPDAGIWEYRKAWQPQTFSSLMCWTAADRAAKVCELHRPARAAHFRAAAERLRQDVCAHGWDPDQKSFVATYGSKDLDAALLQVVPLRFLPRDDPRLASTVDAIAKSLARDGWLYRYQADDGFGRPTVSFVLCMFWLVEALAGLGRGEQAREILDRARAALSPLGLLSEDYDTGTGRLWGNFPQAYSHVGLINAAFAASPRWADVL